jgi:hypothetical protein
MYHGFVVVVLFNVFKRPSLRPGRPSYINARKGEREAMLAPEAIASQRPPRCSVAYMYALKRRKEKEKVM